MGFVTVLKIVALPAAIAAALYGLLTYIVLPLYRAHHDRYSQYLPLHTISERTSSFRARIKHAVIRWLLPRHLQYRFDLQSNGYDIYARRGSSSESEEGEDFAAEEGERMVGFDVGRAADGRGRAGRAMDSERRLSRELERGFRDSSESEEDDRRG